MLRGSSAGSAPRIAGTSRAASTRGSSGARCQRPLACRQSAAVLASDGVGQRVPNAGVIAGGDLRGDRTQPGHAGQPRMRPAPWSSSSQMPASGCRQRPRWRRPRRSRRGRPALSRRSWRAAAANSSSASPNASSWNWALAWLPTDVGAAGVSGQLAVRVRRARRRRRRVGGLEVGPVGEQPLGDEADGVVEQRVRPVDGYGLARRSTGRGSTRSGSRSCGPARRVRAGSSWPRRPCLRRRWSARAARRRSGGRHARRCCALSAGRAVRQCIFGARPQGVRRREAALRGPVGQFDDDVVVAALGDD